MVPCLQDFAAMPSTRVVLALLTLTTSGCSFLFVDGPPAAHKKLPYFDCTSNVTWPTIDLAIGAIGGLQAVDELRSAYGTSTAEVITLAGEAALFAASAV